jgi:hypothetical protein
MRDDVQGCTSNTFDSVIKDLVGELIIVIVKSGQRPGMGQGMQAEECGGSNGSCCRHEGTLCQVGQDFLLLINNGNKVYIPFNAIAAIIEED